MSGVKRWLVDRMLYKPPSTPTYEDNTVNLWIPMDILRDRMVCTKTARKIEINRDNSDEDTFDSSSDTWEYVAVQDSYPQREDDLHPPSSTDEDPSLSDATDSCVNIPCIIGFNGETIPSDSKLVIKDPKSAPYIIIYAHANAEDIGRGGLTVVKRWGKANNCCVLVFEYPNYGLLRSEYQKTEELKHMLENANRGVVADAMVEVMRTVYIYVLRELGWPHEKVLFAGRSLGASVALTCCAKLCEEYETMQAGRVDGRDDGTEERDTSSSSTGPLAPSNTDPPRLPIEPPPLGVLSVSGFARESDLASSAGFFGSVFKKLFGMPHGGWDSIEAIGRISRKLTPILLFVHGDKDELVNIKGLDNLYDAAVRRAGGDQGAKPRSNETETAIYYTTFSPDGVTTQKKIVKGMGHNDAGKHFAEAFVKPTQYALGLYELLPSSSVSPDVSSDKA